MLGRNIVPALRNFGDIVDVRDVGYDAYRSFAGGPRRNVVLDDFGTLNVEEQLTRVVKQGWLYKSGQLQLHNTTILYKRRYVILLSQPPCLVYYKYNPYSHLESPKQDQHIRSSLQGDTTTALGRRAKDLAKKVFPTFHSIPFLNAFYFHYHDDKPHSVLAMQQTLTVPSYLILIRTFSRC